MYAFLERFRFVLMVSVGWTWTAVEPEWFFQSCEATIKVCPPSTKHRRKLNAKVKHPKPKFKNVANVLSCCCWREHWFDLLFGQYRLHVIMIKQRLHHPKAVCKTIGFCVYHFHNPAFVFHVAQWIGATGLACIFPSPCMRAMRMAPRCDTCLSTSLVVLYPESMASVCRDQEPTKVLFGFHVSPINTFVVDVEQPWQLLVHPVKIHPSQWLQLRRLPISSNCLRSSDILCDSPCMCSFGNHSDENFCTRRTSVRNLRSLRPNAHPHLSGAPGWILLVGYLTMLFSGLNPFMWLIPPMMSADPVWASFVSPVRMLGMIRGCSVHRLMVSMSNPVFFTWTHSSFRSCTVSWSIAQCKKTFCRISDFSSMAQTTSLPSPSFQ